MKISYNEACTLKNSTLEKDLALADAAGFSYIEMRIDKLREYLKTHTVSELKAFFETHQIKPHALNGIYAYREFLSDRDDPERFNSLIEDVLFGCRLYYELGIHDIIVVPPIYSEEENKVFTDSWENLAADNVRIFQFLCDLAKPFHVRIGLEIVGAPRCSIRTIPQCNEVIEEVGRDNLGYTIDAFNLYLYSKDDSFDDMDSIIADRMHIVHINGGDDGDLQALRQKDRNYCDRGVMNVSSFIRKLNKLGYDGPVSIEFFREEEWKKPAADVINEAFSSTYSMLKKNDAIY